jgi:hypothetical protein
VAYLRQKSRANFRSTKVDAGKLKRKYLNRPWSTLEVKVLKVGICEISHEVGGKANKNSKPEELEIQISVAFLLCISAATIFLYNIYDTYKL